MQQRAQETAHRILLAGIEEFSAHGYHGAKIDIIAEQASVNKQRIYAYFTNKDGLFHAALQSCFERIITYEQVLLRIDEEQSSQLAERILRHYIRFHEQNPQFWRLLAWSNLENISVEKTHSRIDSPVFLYLRKLYEKAQEEQIYPLNVGFESFMYTLSALSFFYFANQNTMSQFMGMDLARPEVQEKILSEILQLFAMRMESVHD
ncbi:MAG: TetR/AcrR family transcriptional regulator [Planctomycetes bacterium]|nr:TetR/AcrR family transcriptional regulator [Planctomycetota bacterium]